MTHARTRSVWKAAALLSSLVPIAPNARAEEIHLDCERTGQSVKVDVDTARRFLQMVWSDGVAEEYVNGDSYISGPDSYGEEEKVTYAVDIDKSVVSFGQDRVCLKSGAKRKCADKSSRNTLDVAKGELKYDDGETIAVLKCTPAPPGRKF